MTKIIAWDPGKITGVAVGEFSDTEPLRLLRVGELTYQQIVDKYDLLREEPLEDIWVVEIFESRANEFAADLTGVRVEGILESFLGTDRIVWRSPALKSQVPDSILKEHGLWQTGKDVDWEDGRDANDAIIHLLGHVAFGLKHRPTLRKYFK